MGPSTTFLLSGVEGTSYEHTQFVFRCFLCEESMPRNVSRYRSKLELVTHNNQIPTQNTPSNTHGSSSNGSSTNGPSSRVVALYRYQTDQGMHDARYLGTFEPEDTLLTSNKTYIKITTGDSKPQYIATCLSLQEPEDFCGACHRMDNARIIYLAHEHCWALTQSPRPISPQNLATLAHQTRVIVPSVTPSDSEPGFWPSRDLLASLNLNSGLGSIMQRVSSLPQELADMVVEDMRGTKVYSMLKTKNTLLYLLPRLRLGHSPDTVVENMRGTKVHSMLKTNNTPLFLLPRPRLGHSLNPLSCITTILDAPTRLYARESELLGQTYLKELGFNKTKDVLTISLETKPIRGVQFYASGLGIRAVRILYMDKSSSAWLGRWLPHSGWVGTVLGSDLSTLQVRSDNLRIHRVFFKRAVRDGVWNEAGHSKRISYFRSVLWPSGHTIPSDGQMMYCCEKPIERMIGIARALHYPGWRLCEMLSLQEPYMTGLTFYFSDLGISGIEVHFAGGERMVGSEAGYSLHLPLCEGEYLTSAWQFQKPLISVNQDWDFHKKSYNDQTMISVVTSRGRTQHFGTANIREHEYWIREAEGLDSWTCLTPTRSTKITGLVVDKLTTRPRPPFNDIGVVVEKDFVRPQTRTSLTPGLSFENPEIWTRRMQQMDVPTEYGDSEDGFFFVTTASMVNVASILVQQYKDQPVMGMQVVHHDGTTETLGPNGSAKVQDRTAIREVYKSTDGRVDVLRFVDRPGHEGEEFADIEVETSNKADPDAHPRLEGRRSYHGYSSKYLGWIEDDQLLGWAFGTCLLGVSPLRYKMKWQRAFIYRPEMEDIQLPIRDDELEVLV